MKSLRKIESQLLVKNKSNLISFILLVLLLTTFAELPAQTDIWKNELRGNFISSNIQAEDTSENVVGKKKAQKVNIGGLFISPNIGVAFPFGSFADLSNPAFVYGAKFELAYSRLYPFVFGFVYENQKHGGNAEFMNNYLLTQFDTQITYLGGSMDIILNKYVKSDFTTPIFSLEVKYATVNRTISPSLPDSLGIAATESLLTYSAGLGFTIYVFDIGGKYTFAKDYSALTFQMRFHFPIIKF